MAAALRAIGDQLIKRSECPITAVDPQGIQLYRVFGTYIKTLPDRWALAGGDFKTFRTALPNYRVGDITGQSGFFLIQLVGLGYLGYLMGLGNRTPLSYHLTNWTPMAQRIFGDPAAVVPPPTAYGPYDRPVPQRKDNPDIQALRRDYA